MTEIERAAMNARDNAYAPYSGFRVGAAIESEDGHIIVGSNVENASYGLTNCAERVALGAAVALGYQSFKRLAIVTDNDPPCAPCGACRQVLAEFGDMEVVSIGPKGKRNWMLYELLPDRFGPEDLER